MTEKNYDKLDQPLVLQSLFHPRPAPQRRPKDPDRQDLLIPVADKISLGASLHLRAREAPLVLFFHGNGEIVADYDELGGAFTQGAGVNFLVVDYRGYGVSGGSPGVGTMLSDAHRVLDFVETFCQDQGMTGPVNIMGRSLGSAPALELAGSGRRFGSLIIESGFAFAAPLLRVLGLDPEGIGFEEAQGTGNLEKMARVSCPCLIIHAQRDLLIPFLDGQALYEACPSETKHLLQINGAGHNDIFVCGMAPYLAQVRRFCRGV